MSDYKFACPYCKQHVEAPEDMLGLVVECPSCKRQFKIPEARAKKSRQVRGAESSTCGQAPSSAAPVKPGGNSPVVTGSSEEGGCGQKIGGLFFAAIVISCMRACNDSSEVKKSTGANTPAVVQSVSKSSSQTTGLYDEVIASTKARILSESGKNKKLFLESLLGHLNRIKAGGNVNEEVAGCTALIAASGSHPQAVKILIEKGAGVNVMSSGARLTPLMAAASEGCSEGVRLLLEKGASVNVKGKYGMTALILAAAGGHDVVLKQLLEGGADVYARETRLGLTALGMAEKKGYGKCVEILRGYQLGKAVSAPDANAARPAEPLASDAGFSRSGERTKAYVDPVNGFFEFQPPEGYKIVVRRDKSEFRITEGPHRGTTVPSSYVMLEAERAQIIIIARKTYQSFEEAVQSLVPELKRRISVESERKVTVDGEEAIEVVGVGGGMKIYTVKYKKHGLDHTLSLFCPPSAFSARKDAFDAVLKTYRSRSN